MAVATCIECDEEIEISGRLRLGQKVICPNCAASLEIASLNPLELDWAYEDDNDDWDDDDDLGDDFEDDDELGFEDDDFEDEEDDIKYNDDDEL